MTFIIDIDDTIFFSAKTYCDICGRKNYNITLYDNIEIERINKLYDSGNTIILWTGRNWDSYDLTKKQLKEKKVKYHELFMGKPQGIYIDKDARKTLEEFC